MSLSTKPFESSHAGINNGTAIRASSQTFFPPLVPEKPLNNTYSGRNGALAATVFAGIGRQRPTTTSIEEKAPYLKIEMAPQVETLPIKRSPINHPPRSIDKDDPKQPTWNRGQSPSHIAALVAASKPSLTYHTSQAGSSLHPNSRRPLDLPNTPSEPLPMIQHLDETPIPATNTLVKLFESQTGIPNPSFEFHFSRQQELPPKSASTPNIALTTGKELSEFTRPKAAEGSSDKIIAARPPLREMEPVSRSNVGVTATARIVESSTARPETSKREISQKGPPPMPPPPRRTRQDRGVVKPRSNGRSSFANDSDGTSSTSSYASALDVIHSPQAYGGLIPNLELATTRATRSSGQAQRSLSANSLSLSRQQNSRGVITDSDRDDNFMARKRSLREGPLLSNSLTPQLTADSLANAMVASSLASSRAPSPSKPAPPLPRRHPKPHSIFNRSHSQELVASRTPSPGRGMRQTMRESPKPEDDEEYKKRGGYLLKKHPNKHHEGDRKRWRDQITEQERKRYEGVWAANKGLLMPSNDAASAVTVVNLVVRDIWRRSRLPDDVLEEIWDLVDGEKIGRLGKEEFVVGLWLIDQRLKGRKLPMKVSESVWFSVRRLSGIKVSKKPR